MHLRRFLLYVVFLLASIMAVDVHATDGSSWWNTDYNTTEGTEFWVTYMVNYGKQVQDTDFVLVLYATARTTTQVFVSGTWTDYGGQSSHPYNASFVVHAGQVDSIIIPHEVAYLQNGGQLTNLEWLNKGIKIVSESPISLYNLNANGDSYDASLILPIEGLYKDYVIQTFDRDEQSTEFAIVSSRDNNNITINLAETQGTTVRRNTFSITLDEGQTYCYRPLDRFISLTGTTICASQPIAVFQGGQHAKVPPNQDPASHIFHQTFPTDLLGKSYFVTRTANQAYDIVRITAAENGTKIYKSGQLVKTLQRLETYEDQIHWQTDQQAIHYYTSRASACYLYSSKRSSPIGAPYMTSIVPTEQGVKSIILATFHENRSRELECPQDTIDFYYKHYVNIVTQTSCVSGMRIDNVDISNLFSPVGTTGYSCAIVEISDTAHYLTNHLGTFTSRVYGLYGYQGDNYYYEHSLSYGYSGGNNCLHPAWMLINGEQTDSVAVCEDEMPVTFTSVINYDYTNVRWEHHHHYHDLLGRDSNIISPSSVNGDGLQATGDSVYSRYYEDIPRGLPLVDHIDTVYMIVTRKTPICDNIIIDTIKAIVQVNDTFRIDENAEYNLNGNVCYGDSFTVHHQNQDYHYIADTTSTQYYDGKLIKFKLNEPYSFFDSLKTQYGCDSVINQIRILRPTYETSVTDTICVNHLPYSNTLSDGNGTEHTITIDLTRNQKNSITGKSTRRLNPIIKDTTVLLKTIYDCDSIVHLKLVVLPIYEIQSPAVTTCMDSTQYYEWAGHTSKTGIFSGHKIYLDGQRITTGISLQTPGTFTYVDSLKTKGCKQCNDRPGCDSVYKITITVLEQVVIRNSQTLCANESFEWNDSLYIGPSFDINDLPSKYRTNRKYRRIGNTTLVREFTTADDFHCAALDMLYVTWCPTYNTTETVHICETEVYYFRPSSKDHSHDKTFNQNHEWACQTDAHGAKIVGQYTLRDTVETNIICTNNHGCDSIVTHIVYVHPTYDFVKVDSVCQGYPYVWNDHTNRDLYDSIQQKKVHFAESIPANEPGWHTYVDQLKTVTCEDCATGGCDSIWTLRLYVEQTRRATVNKTICPEQLPYAYGDNGKYATQAGTYIDTLRRSVENGCDSITTYVITVSDEIKEDIYVTICDDRTPYTYELNDTVPVWQNLMVTGNYPYVFKQVGKCDSMVVLHLVVNAVGRETIERRSCQNNSGYYYENLNNGAGGMLPSRHLSDALTRNDTISTALGCDSIVTLHYYVDSVYNYTSQQVVCQAYGEEWIWYEKGVPQDTISIDRGDTTFILGRSYKTIHGCDSTFGISVYVAPIYHFYDTLSLCEDDSISWQGILFTGREFVNYHPGGYNVSLYRRVQDGLIGRTAYYEDTAQYYTIHSCDSVYHLALKVNAVYRTTIERRSCQTADGYYYEHLNNGQGGVLSALHLSDSLQRNDTVRTIAGCDSIITLYYYVDSVYDYRQTIQVCQDTINFQWEWFDDDSISHGFIDISESGNYNYTDSFTTIYGCDSIYGLALRVSPIYRFDSTYVICQDERVDWQGRGYSGSEYGWGYVRLPGDRPDENKDSIYYHYVPTDSILAAGVYYDTARYTTVEGCDSTYYLTLIVNPAGHEIRNAHVCDKDAFYVFHTDDIYGHHTDTIFFPLISRMLSATMKDTLYYETERRLRTSRDCDSTVHMHLTVHPTYQFVTRAKICWNQQYEWRDHVCEDTTGAFPTRKYNKTGIYYDSCATKRWNCDSVYVLELFVKPVTIINRFIHVCENETYWHIDTAWNRLDSTIYSVDSTIVWTPGMQILDTNEYRDVTFISPDGCDSLIYRYHVTLEKTYLFDTLVTMCSSESFPLHAGHIFVPITDYYDTHSSVASYDTTYSDTLRSIWGCDSIYRIRARIHPSYRYIAYDTICERDPFIWRDEQRIYNGHGDFVFYDRYQTALYHCDSIYEMRLHVHESPIENTTEYICEEDLPYHYTFSDKYTDIYVSGYYTDTLPNRFGCDSILNLTLVVLDTLVTIEYDTICHSDTLLRGHFAGWNLTKAGAYYDTTAIDTILFCKHYWTLYLHVIEPTYYDLFVPEICADEDSLIIGYSYYGRPIESYTVYFEYSEAVPHFETVYTGELDPDDRTFGIPMPFGDALPHPNPTYFDTKQGIQQYTYEDRYQYIRPDTYKMTVILHNGICSDRLQRKDTTLNIIYPSWIHEQHWNDGIVLFNEKYNGGYTFTHYQWYYNDEPIIGQTREFLYWPDSTRLMNEPGQSEDDYCEKEYKVLLTRSDDGKSIFTCPICPIHIFDSIVPREDYFAIVPTLVVVENPVVWILATQPGTYSYCIFTGEGRSRGCGSLALSKGTYTPDQNNYAGTLTLPVVYDGYLFIELCPPNGECRTFKIKMIQGH